ncbi:MAG: nucleotidyl transferase AbiEii/AbiGii toxin family protein [Kiritimatiellia bacterium]|nr:nucleotidyl transferase AbiEii/AbiGii toxin family protein [Kiritimatiellia bacterium]
MKPANLPLSHPVNMDELAEECLQALAQRGLGKIISIGGALGLLHYLDYRFTRDADAWWNDSAAETEKQQVIEVVRQVLASRGNVQIRSWGDVISIELENKGRVVFSFQIARRSARLSESRKAAWADIWVDSWEDLVASKMTALIERGAPRDFRDIFAVCKAELAAPADCWTLWAKRQLLAGSDADPKRARLALQAHLKRIALHRPLEEIKDGKERAEADGLRRWFNGEFIDALK